MLTDQELQTLRNLGNEAEAAADEIVALRARMMELAALVPIAEANERERCAKLVQNMDTTGHDGYIETAGDLCEALAACIRRA